MFLSRFRVFYRQMRLGHIGRYEFSPFGQRQKFRPQIAVEEAAVEDGNFCVFERRDLAIDVCHAAEGGAAFQCLIECRLIEWADAPGFPGAFHGR